MRILIENKFKRVFIFLIFCAVAMLSTSFSISAQKSKIALSGQTETITIITEPKATIWFDGIKYGETDETGRFAAKIVSGKTKKLRVRADGFKEVSQNLLPAAQKGEVKIALIKTTDEAELAFQEAERFTTTDRQKARQMYEKAIKLRPRYAEASLGLARVLSDSGDLQGALEAVKQAKKARPIYAEATAVEGRIYKAEDEEDKAVAAYKRSVAEGKGFQPEAFTGLALLYKEKAEAAGAEGDFHNEELYYEEAAKFFTSAISQLSLTPDAVIVYQLLGLIYEKMKKYDEAIALYEEFLRVFPDANESSAVRSFIVQLKKQMSGQE